MVSKNLYEIVNTDGIPSMDYLVKKEFSDYRNLLKTISLKEIEFRSYNRWEHDFDLQSVQLEKELGQLYTELNRFVKALNIISGS